MMLFLFVKIFNYNFHSGRYEFEYETIKLILKKTLHTFVTTSKQNITDNLWEKY